MRRLLPFLAALPLLVTLGPAAPAPAAASSSPFNFNWDGAPATPQPWVPGQVNDWDVIANIDGPVDRNGSMEAGHGGDCSPPPATHHVVELADSVFICKNHMMTAVFGGGDAFVGYGAVYFAPAQLVDWSQAPASVSWKVSTERTSTRDWWDVQLTPFDQNLVVPFAGHVAYQGEPPTGLYLHLDNTGCRAVRTGSFLRVEEIVDGEPRDLTQRRSCIEDAVAPSAQTRSQFQIDLRRATSGSSCRARTWSGTTAP